MPLLSFSLTQIFNFSGVQNFVLLVESVRDLKTTHAFMVDI